MDNCEGLGAAMAAAAARDKADAAKNSCDDVLSILKDLTKRIEALEKKKD